jgi:dihydropteroate synthase
MSAVVRWIRNAATIAALQVPYIAMHMKGTPQTMQQLANYENVTAKYLIFYPEKK